MGYKTWTHHQQPARMGLRAPIFYWSEKRNQWVNVPPEEDNSFVAFTRDFYSLYGKRSYGEVAEVRLLQGHNHLIKCDRLGRNNKERCFACDLKCPTVSVPIYAWGWHANFSVRGNGGAGASGGDILPSREEAMDWVIKRIKEAAAKERQIAEEITRLRATDPGAFEPDHDTEPPDAALMPPEVEE